MTAPKEVAPDTLSLSVSSISELSLAHPFNNPAYTAVAQEDNEPASLYTLHALCSLVNDHPEIPRKINPKWIISCVIAHQCLAVCTPKQSGLAKPKFQEAKSLGLEKP